MALISQTLDGGVFNPVAPRQSPLNPTQGIFQFGDLISLFIKIGFLVAFLAFFIMFILGAIRWILSSGDKHKLEPARGTIVNALIGLVLILSLFAVIKFIETMFGISILEIDFGKLKI